MNFAQINSKNDIVDARKGLQLREDEGGVLGVGEGKGWRERERVGGWILVYMYYTRLCASVKM